MITRYEFSRRSLSASPKRWLVTGAAGFIGSHLVEALLKLNQVVVGLDNFITGRRENLEDVRAQVSSEQWERFRFEEGDIRTADVCRSVCEGVDYVLHQAALGSVPRSVLHPLGSHDNNVNGFLNMIMAARDARVARFVYASSSSVYGDSAALPKVEQVIGNPLSPYAATKLADEIYAQAFLRCYGMRCVGLRYFNVFGPRQDPSGAYAAVIPKWFAASIDGGEIKINGDGETTRDFCFVDNVVQANILSATVDIQGDAAVFNVAVGQRTTLNALASHIQRLVVAKQGRGAVSILRGPHRDGDIRHSLADIGLAKAFLGYEPSHTLEQGLFELCQWYFRHLPIRSECK